MKKTQTSHNRSKILSKEYDRCMENYLKTKTCCYAIKTSGVIKNTSEIIMNCLLAEKKVEIDLMNITSKFYQNKNEREQLEIIMRYLENKK